MPIKLISEQERHCCPIGDAQIFYRRVPSYVQQKIEHQHTRRGQPDTRQIVEEVLAYGIVGWENVTDADGQDVPYSPDLIKYLPEEAKGELIGKLYESDPLGDSLGNSKNGSRPA